MNTFRKIYALLSKKERRQVVWVLPVITLMALLQVVGIASVAPFMALVANPNTITTNRYLSWAYTTFGFANPTSFLIASGIGALLVILFTNMFTAYTTWLIYKFSWDTYHSLSERTLINYLYKPYSFYLNRNTADLGKNILSESQRHGASGARPGDEPHPPGAWWRPSCCSRSSSSTPCWPSLCSGSSAELTASFFTL